MPGATIQIMAKGLIDLYLSGNPQFTYWKTVYKRCTNFSMQFIRINPEQNYKFQQGYEFREKLSFKLKRYGDMLHKIYLVFDLPDIYSDERSEFRWVDYLGYSIFDEMRFFIGESIIDRQYNEWMTVWNELTLPDGKRTSYDNIIGNSPDFKIYPRKTLIAGLAAIGDDYPENLILYPKKRLYIPLNFWFCQNPGLALPLCALQYDECRIEIDFTPPEEWFLLGASESKPSKFFDIENPKMGNDSVIFRQLLLDNGFNRNNIWSYFLAPGFNPDAQSQWTPNCYLDCQYVFLDDVERTYFTETTHEYLITQTQRNLFFELKPGINKVRLNLTKPVKEFVFMFGKKDVRGNNNIYNYTQIGKPNIFNYYNDAVQNTIFATNIPLVTNDVYITESNVSQTMIGSNYLINFANLIDNIKTVVAENKNNISDNLLDIFQGGNFIFNGKDRTEYKDKNYYELVEVYKNHSNYPRIDGVYVYSFGLKPEKNSPSGTSNFNRISTVEFQFNLKDSMELENFEQLYGLLANYANYGIFDVSPGEYSPIFNTNPFTNNNPVSSVSFTQQGVPYELRFYALNYNLLRIVAGSGSLGFA